MREIWPGRLRALHRDDTTAGQAPHEHFRRCLRYCWGYQSDPTDRAAGGIDRRGIATVVSPAAGEPDLLGFQYVGLLPVSPSNAAGGTFDGSSTTSREAVEKHFASRL